MEQQRAKTDEAYQRMQDSLQIVVGTPEEVTAKLKTVIECLRPGMLFFMGPQGDMAHEDRERNIRLIGEEVLPELRAHVRSGDYTEAVALANQLLGGGAVAEGRELVHEQGEVAES